MVSIRLVPFGDVFSFIVFAAAGFFPPPLAFALVVAITLVFFPSKNIIGFSFLVSKDNDFYSFSHYNMYIFSSKLRVNSTSMIGNNKLVFCLEVDGTQSNH